ncbi:MAG: bifunctional phosphopantothenoylcysteine decarboxylase/phosphopantothenate--cysteine ligase CoaBC [Methanosarcinales archaeon Met12]|nr:MAG: bifunctional phosphopantothenoylcysteine decarboxylase/phosphopantothenate--cysteine ligase CoaBC [Methanosarcinales archaeon Met12]
MHPTTDIRGSKGDELGGKKIVLCVTGSIAAVEAVKLARELVRHGADVYAVMSDAAQKVIHQDALQYAIGRNVISGLTGDVEHIELCGDGTGKADLLLIAPCTANTIGKIATGIDDTPVTTFASTALGTKIPIIIAPAMHESMYSQPIVADNIQRLKRLGIEFVGPRLEEGKAKIADVEDIVLYVLRTLSEKGLKGKKVLIAAGATAESIDPIRILTSRSSGRTGLELGREAFIRGADVTLVHRGDSPYPMMRHIHVESAGEMTDAVLDELKGGYDIFICAAAISDYTVNRAPNKIPSGKNLTLPLKPVPKLIGLVREQYPDLPMVGFKAETNVATDVLIDRAKSLKDAVRLDLIVANDVGKGGIGEDENEVYIIGEDIVHVKGSKRDIAKKVIDAIVGIL